MKSDKDWLIDRISVGMEKEDAQRFAQLINHLNDVEERERSTRCESSLNAAMLADICETTFDGCAGGAPYLMSYAHAGWACGPGSKKPEESYVRWSMVLWYKEKISKESLERIDQWESYLKTLKKV
jgi:hypothetical protein